MSRKSTLLASSLSVCAATASWAVLSSAEEPALPVEKLNADLNHLQRDSQEAVYKYLNPVAINWEGKEKVETKVLTYRVAEGDTLSKVARLYKQNYQNIANFNKLQNPDLISADQVLQVEAKVKLVTVPTDNLPVEAFAKKHQMDLDVLLQLNSTVKKGSKLKEGQLLYVLADQNVISTASVKKASTSKIDNKVVQFRQGKIRVAPQGRYIFSWPVKGTITSHFGPRNGRQHKGMDIVHSARTEAPIKAALDGVVKRAGYFNNGYGNLVVIDHGGGWETYYAHLSSVKVKVGQRVSTGDLLGYMGTTGNSTGVHLHFEIRKNGKPYNPANYLK